MLRSISLLLLAAAAPGFAAFRASAVKIDITPSTPQWLLGYNARQSTGVHDKIYHRIAALDDGTTQFFLIATDLCLFSPGVYDEFTQDLQRQTGVDAQHVWWTVTHTHSAPEVGPPGVNKVMALATRFNHEWDHDYTQRILRSLIDGIKEARAKLEPARLAIGVGMARANINRRARDVDGKISLGLNPDGPVDRQIGLIRLEKPDGTPIALIANYAMHGTVLSGKNMEISGDGPGVVAAYVEEKLGAPMLYVNGAAGNLAPIYTVYDTPRLGHLSEFRVLLGDRILEANRQTLAAAEVKLWAGEHVIESPRKNGMGWPEDLARYARTSSAGTPLVRLPVRFLKLNDTVVWAAPVELFCEIAMRVRADSPFANTFYFGYTNGWFGYLPTARAFEEGGYEPNTSVFTGQVERDLTEGVITFLQGLR